MPFHPVKCDHLTNWEMRRVFQHASGYLADVYTLMHADPGPEKSGAGNFSIALILSCVIDGLATEIYPIQPVDDQEKRMRVLLERMPWGTKAQGWVTRGEAARVLYLDIRNPLAHNLAADTNPNVRRPGYADPALVKRMRDWTRPTASELEEMSEWPNKKWPVMWAEDSHGKRRIVLSDLALYWHVKRLTVQLAADTAFLQRAVDLRKRRRVRGRGAG